MPDRDPVLLMPPPADLLDTASLFLDFDGTLVELADRPDGVVVNDALIDLIRALEERLAGRLALVSGRPAEDLAAFFGDRAPCVVGSHGMEYRWSDGRRARAERPDGLMEALAEMRAFAEARPGVVLEDKPLGAAVHYRMNPAQEADAVAMAERLAATHGLYLQHGKMMVEVRSAGGDKGSAIRTLMADPRFASGRPVFLGDDVTDEPGFSAVAALGGAGVLVGPPRPTDARYRVDDVESVLAWLGAAIGVHA
ncbi:trehalose-phosphatase [uncultured Sphingomonas sp.]|uniref:trehalose-phosphatase n=1 Tax=uncultured Sphingomonas sp. TaxID=158754 RepID=UPI0025CFB84A|nr:trehalose-phosphatase [uncultured Sphingomonas sp.]